MRVKKAAPIWDGLFLCRLLILVDDGAHMFAIERSQDVLGMTQGIDDLKFLQAFGMLEKGQDRPFHDEIVQIHG